MELGLENKRKFKRCFAHLTLRKIKSWVIYSVSLTYNSYTLEMLRKLIIETCLKNKRKIYKRCFAHSALWKVSDSFTTWSKDVLTLQMIENLKIKTWIGKKYFLRTISLDACFWMPNCSQSTWNWVVVFVSLDSLIYVD